MKTSPSHKLLLGFSIIIFPSILLGFLVMYWRDPSRYLSFLAEDSSIEMLTFWLLILTGVLSVAHASEQRKNRGALPWFFMVFGLLALLAGMEEISWGQRLFGFETPEYLVEKSDQPEINLHNFFQGVTGIMTRHIVAFTLLVYGVVLPFLSDKNRVRRRIEKWGVYIPRRYLCVGFFIGALWSFDWITNQDEELGEMMLALALFLMILSAILDARLRRNSQESPK
ncbi:MAG: hypothetical protein ACLFUS_02530 [Candidatus Sumerlaeia bacterium]